MVGIVVRRGIAGIVLALGLAASAAAEPPAPRAWMELDAQYAWTPAYPSRTYLDDLAPPPRIQDKRRVKLRYEHPVRLGQTKMVLRFRASPKPRKIVRFEVRF